MEVPGLQSASFQYSLWTNTMNRCLYPARVRLLTLCSTLALGALSLAPSLSAAQTLTREFPATARRAMLEVVQPPEILLNGQSARLSPGARIKGLTNTVVMSGSLVGQRVLVNYVRDGHGLVHEAWILTPQEAQQERKGMEAITNFTFASDADKPKTDDGKTPFDQLPTFGKP